MICERLSNKFQQSLPQGAAFYDGLPLIARAKVVGESIVMVKTTAAVYFWPRQAEAKHMPVKYEAGNKGSGTLHAEFN